MDIIGRVTERRLLEECFESERPDFLVVYGRRRVGKTFLVREVFKDRFCFRYTGYAGLTTRRQLARFQVALNEFDNRDFPLPGDWFTALDYLRELIENSPIPGKKIVFLDEMPWMDSRQSNFLSALEGFWNGWASGRDDMLLIACGSATSWITRKLFRNRAGLHNRVTRRMLLEPFSLKECHDFFSRKGFDYTHRHIAESYMTFGGIPYYLDLFSPELSPTQNANALCFEANGALTDEYQSLYASLFDQPQRYTTVVEVLASKARGLNRQEIVEATGLSNGGTLTKMLSDLEQCGFIRKYREYGKKNKDAIFQLLDPYTLFYLKKAKGHVAVDEDYWTNSLQSGSRNAWGGYAFEMLCLWHLPQIKARLGIAGISTEAYAWRSKTSQPGAQIDLVIERKDRIINLCEIKNTAAPLEVNEGFIQELNAKKAAFRSETGTTKTLHTTLISASPLPRASSRHDIQSVITLEDLFV